MKENKNSWEYIEKRIQELQSTLGDPNRIFPQRGQREALEKELKELIEKQKTLRPTPIEAGTITFSLPVKFYNEDKNLCLEQGKDGTWKLSKTDWQFDRATYELIVDPKTNLPTKILRQYVGSETYGKPQLYSYDVKLEEPKLNPLVKRQPFVKPCSKIEEAKATLNQDEKYWNSMGLIKDSTTGGYRKKTPFELQAKEIAESKKKKEKSKKKSSKLNIFKKVFYNE